MRVVERMYGYMCWLMVSVHRLSYLIAEMSVVYACQFNISNVRYVH